MHYWRATLTHTAIILAQPLYLFLRHLWSPKSPFSLTTPSTTHGLLNTLPLPPLNLTIHAVIWTYILTRITIPFFKSPLRHLPSPPDERWPFCHLNLNGGEPARAGLLFESWFSRPEEFTPPLTPRTDSGLVVLWLPFYLGCEVLVTHPNTCQETLGTRNYDFEKPVLINRFFARILGRGLANVEGREHREMRRVVGPSFSGTQIRKLAGLFWIKGLEMARTWAVEIGGAEGVVDVTKLLSRDTLEIIGMAVLGDEFGEIKGGENSRLAGLYRRIMEAPAHFMILSVYLPQWLLKTFGTGAIRRTIDAQTDLRAEVGELLQEKKRIVKEDEGLGGGRNIISTIMQAGDFDDAFLTSQLLTFLAAGYEARRPLIRGLC
jgi:cytochrome P450